MTSLQGSSEGLHPGGGVCIQERGSASRGRGSASRGGGLHPGEGVCIHGRGMNPGEGVCILGGGGKRLHILGEGSTTKGGLYPEGSASRGRRSATGKSASSREGGWCQGVDYLTNIHSFRSFWSFIYYFGLFHLSLI